MNSTHDIEANRRSPVLGTEDKDNRVSETHAPPDLESDVSSSPIGPQQAEPKENDDFDERAAEFWAVYVREARSHDEASIGTWKDDMEGIIIFAGLYSAVLTSFITESQKSLTLDPADEIAYYARQAVVLLAQISAQLTASGSPVPSTVPFPPAFPQFHAAKSDVRVNIYWFMSLVFSLSAALGATLVQQWAREYVQFFQRYNHPIKRARIRQFLHEGANRWHMDLVVHLVPALIHISLFLFFLGLADSLFKINVATATTTTILIVICALCYLFSIIAPIWDAQSPFQSPLSPMFWHLFFWKFSRRTYKDHSTGGKNTPISTDMKEGRVQLAMNYSEDRKHRDARAIEWIVDDLTEDSELELLVRNIPDSFNSTWGKDVLQAVTDDKGKEDSGAFSRIDSRIARLLRTCTDPGSFPGKTEREQRASACVGASLSLMLSVEYEWAWLAKSEIPTMAQVLIYLSDVRTIRDAKIRDVREAPTSELDSTSSIRWTCMSIIVVRRVLQTFDEVGSAADRVIKGLAKVRGVTEGSQDENAAKTARTLNEYLKTSWNSAASLHQELIRDVDPDNVEDRVRNIMQEKKSDITTLDDTWNVCGWAEETDEAIVTLAQTLREATSGVLDRFNGAVLPWKQDSRLESEKGTQSTPSFFMPQFIPPRLLIQHLWLCVSALRRVSSIGWGAGAQNWKRLADLSAPELSIPEMRKLIAETRTPMVTQLWRLQDLRSGGLVYSLELFIQAIKSSGKAALRESSRELYGGTFLVITRRWWDEYDRGVWTERLLVDLLRRVLPTGDDSSSDQIPTYIIDHLLKFLADVLATKSGSHVQDAISQIQTYSERPGYPGEVAREVLSRIALAGT